MGTGDLEPGVWLSRYRIDERLGVGGMGTVWGAWDELLRRRVALKVVFRGDDPDAAVAEARAMAAVRHPHVATVYGVERDDQRAVVVMERIDGTSLDHELERGTFAPREVVRIVLEIAAALGAIHRAGLVHGDVKPSNVLLEHGSGRVVVTDFGLSSEFEGGQGITSLRGTPDYLCPERACAQLVPRELRVRQDVYALACTTFELLTGCVPFDDERVSRMLWLHVHAPVPRVSDIVPLLGWRVDRAIARGLAKDPAVRTASPAQFALDVARAVEKGSARTRVLVVDDDPLDREYLTYALAKRLRGFVFQSAPDGESGYRAALAYPPDLVILDLAMPHTNGVELAGLLRATPELESTPIVVVSGAISDGERRVLARMGVEALLHKPVTPVRVVDIVRQQLGLRDPFAPEPTKTPPRLREAVTLDA